MLALEGNCSFCLVLFLVGSGRGLEEGGGTAQGVELLGIEKCVAGEVLEQCSTCKGC